MKKIFALFTLTLLMVQCASKPLTLEQKDFSSEAAFKAIAEVNRIVPHFQRGNPTVEEISQILQQEMTYDLPSGYWVATLDSYSVTARFDGELKDAETALTQVNFNFAPKDILSFADIQSAFGSDYVTVRQAQTVVIQQKLAHASNVEFLVHLGEPADQPDQPVRSLLVRSKK